VADHSACAQELLGRMAPYKVTVSGAPPLVLGQFTTEPFICPHGKMLWIEPAGEQYMEWAAARGASGGQ
jgi:hypothetical protein